MQGPFTPAPICLAIWSYYLYTLLIKNPKLQPNTQAQMEAPNLSSQPTYRIGSRLARQIWSFHMKLYIWLKKIFIDLFNAKIIQENRQCCRNSLNFFWKTLMVALVRTTPLEITLAKGLLYSRIEHTGSSEYLNSTFPELLSHVKILFGILRNFFMANCGKTSGKKNFPSKKD